MITHQLCNLQKMCEKHGVVDECKGYAPPHVSLARAHNLVLVL
jgi:hypothetical protein